MWYSAFLIRTAKKHSTVIVALDLNDREAADVAADPKDLPDDSKREGARELHITLCYLGEAAEIADKKQQIEETVKSFATAHKPISGKVNGIGRFHVDGDGEEPLYASFDSPDLPEFRHGLVKALEDAGIKIDNTHGFTPHITIAYIPKEAETPDLRLGRELTFKRVSLFWAGDKTHYNL